MSARLARSQRDKAAPACFATSTTLADRLKAVPHESGDLGVAEASASKMLGDGARKWPRRTATGLVIERVEEGIELQPVPKGYESLALGRRQKVPVLGLEQPINVALKGASCQVAVYLDDGETNA